jgi:glutamyl-tRNA synthetase
MHGDPVHVAHHLRWHLGQLDIDPTTGPDPVKVVEAQRERNKTLVDMAKSSAFFYKDFDGYDEKAAAKNLAREAIPALRALQSDLDALETWEKEALHRAIAATAETLGVKMGSVAQPLRVAVSGTSVSPPIDLTLEILGKAKTLARIEQALDYLCKKN